MQVQWTPYACEDVTEQPWVTGALPFARRDVWLHCMNVVEPLHARLVMRTTGVPQPVVDFPAQESVRVTRSTRGLTQQCDWAARNAEQIADWQAGGRAVTARADSDAAYVTAYVRHYGDRVYRGARRPVRLYT